MDRVQVQRLEGAALEYAYLDAFGKVLFGHPQGPFAAYSPDNGVLSVFGGNTEKVEFLTLEGSLSREVLDEAQKYGARFLVDGDKVVCHIGDVTTSGENYSQAAMRALILHLTSNADSTELVASAQPAS